jgi:hypothetical protein
MHGAEFSTRRAVLRVSAHLRELRAQKIVAQRWPPVTDRGGMKRDSKHAAE